MWQEVRFKSYVTINEWNITKGFMRLRCMLCVTARDRIVTSGKDNTRRWSRWEDFNQIFPQLWWSVE